MDESLLKYGFFFSTSKVHDKGSYWIKISKSLKDYKLFL